MTPEERAAARAHIIAGRTYPWPDLSEPIVRYLADALDALDAMETSRDYWRTLAGELNDRLER